MDLFRESAKLSEVASVHVLEDQFLPGAAHFTTVITDDVLRFGTLECAVFAGINQLKTIESDF